MAVNSFYQSLFVTRDISRADLCQNVFWLVNEVNSFPTTFTFPYICITANITSVVNSIIQVYLDIHTAAFSDSYMACIASDLSQSESGKLNRI